MFIGITLKKEYYAEPLYLMANRYPVYYGFERDECTTLSSEHKTLECIQKIKFTYYTKRDHLLLKFKDGTNQIISITSEHDYYA